ncbi:acetylxylan esterase [Bacteroides ovatus]|nr:acetylxylan esterase [Bacteroides ovatus]
MMPSPGFPVPTTIPVGVSWSFHPVDKASNKPYNRFGEWIAFGLDSPKHYYYRGAFADTVRSIDFIFAQPCFDGQNLFATGISQGGALTLAAASLDHRISAAAPIVPFLSDYPDYFRLVHWYCQLGIRRSCPAEY